MVKPRAYIESTVISYYTARPTRDVVMAGHQAVTVEWWDGDLPKFTPIISVVVLDEISRGDPEAAAKRLATVSAMDVLQLMEEAEQLAIAYYDAIALPDAPGPMHCIWRWRHGMAPTTW